MARSLLTDRWYPLKWHPEQARLETSTARFKVVPAGRRSGKTERAKRHGVRKAWALPRGGRVGFGAPTRDQAKQIFWDDLKAMIPRWGMQRAPKETDLSILLRNGVEIRVVGMDRPERVEGTPWDWFCLDEYANCKEEAWAAHLYPALSTIGREGEAWLIGVPEGRNHYYETYKKALADTSGIWDAFTWLSADILPPDTIEQAKRDLDPLTYEQEYEASFVNFRGQAYYVFRDTLHCVKGTTEKHYRKRAPLSFCFDFNVEPGVACVVQSAEFELPRVREAVKLGDKVVVGEHAHTVKVDGEAVIGEVYIPHNSNTPAVCNKLIADWGDHEGPIYLYGDATGGARGTAQLDGSDWDLIMKAMYGHFGRDRVFRKGRRNASSGAWHNPSERSRVNAVNTRLLSGDGIVRLIVDPTHAPYVVRDLEGVRLLEGGSGEIDKKNDPELTHISDALGYKIEFDHPITTSKRASVLRNAF